jgi:hypothetical protein
MTFPHLPRSRVLRRYKCPWVLVRVLEVLQAGPRSAPKSAGKPITTGLVAL